MSQKEISCNKKETSCHRKESQLDISSHRIKFHVTGRHFLSKAKLSSHMKKFLVTERKFLSQKEFPCSHVIVCSNEQVLGRGTF